MCVDVCVGVVGFFEGRSFGGIFFGFDDELVVIVEVVECGEDCWEIYVVEFWSCEYVFGDGVVE